MNKSNYTLIIDGNFFLFRTLYVLPKPKSDEQRLKNKKEVSMYINKLATDLTYQIRLFDGLIDEIVWTLDSKSWRKDFFPEAEYKGNRTNDSSINWNNFSEATDRFCEILKSNGIIISKTDGAEGDDLIYAWNTQILSDKDNPKSTIIFTGDRDLNQLVTTNKANENHCILFSPANKKLYTYEGFSDWLEISEEDNKQSNESSNESFDFFDSLKIENTKEKEIKKTLSNIIKTKKLELIELNTDEFRFKKVLTGDKGDNVMSAYWYRKTTKSGQERLYGISNAKAQSIVDEFKQKHGGLNILWFYNDDYLKDLRNILIRQTKAKFMKSSEILNNIKNNINLMILDSKTIPEDILNEMFKSIEEFKSMNIKLNIKSANTAKKLLEGTEFAKKDISISSPILDDSDDDGDDDFSFIKSKNKPKNLF